MFGLLLNLAKYVYNNEAAGTVCLVTFGIPTS